MRSIFRFAEKYYDMENPARNSDPIVKEKPADEMQFWTKEELEKVIQSMVIQHYRAEVALKILFWTGMRSGELLALTINDIDFDTKTISITKTYARVKGKDRISPPKTPKSKRNIRISDSLLDEIHVYVNRLYGYEPTERLFPHTKDFLRYTIDKYSKKADVTAYGSMIYDTRMHPCLNMGVDILLISQRLGHENIQTTLDTYSHLYPGRQLQIAESLDKFMIPKESTKENYGVKMGSKQKNKIDKP